MMSHTWSPAAWKAEARSLPEPGAAVCICVDMPAWDTAMATVRAQVLMGKQLSSTHLLWNAAPWQARSNWSKRHGLKL